MKFPTANQDPSNDYFYGNEVQKAKWSRPSERAMKTELKICARLLVEFRYLPAFSNGFD